MARRSLDITVSKGQREMNGPFENMLQVEKAYRDVSSGRVSSCLPGVRFNPTLRQVLAL